MLLQEAWPRFPPQGFCPCSSLAQFALSSLLSAPRDFLLRLHVSAYFLGGVSGPSQRPLKLSLPLRTMALELAPA